MKPEEPEFMTGRDGRIVRRFWDNIFCKFCGNQLAPNESYGESPAEPGICMGCLRIIFDEIEEEMANEH